MKPAFVTPTTAVRTSTAVDVPRPGRREPRIAYLVAKRILDVAGATLILIVASPLLATAALAVALTSRGPVLFRQIRVGQHGRTFVCLKLRSMRHGADDTPHRAYVQRVLTEDAPADGSQGVFKLIHDDRVTPVGGLLRRTSIDELPQLLNVLRGEMSLVGPRPMLPWEAQLLEPWHATRFEVKPGLTGLWQVSGRSRVSAREALRLDVEYVRSQSLRLDLHILRRTPAAVLHLGDAA